MCKCGFCKREKSDMMSYAPIVKRKGRLVWDKPTFICGTCYRNLRKVMSN